MNVVPHQLKIAAAIAVLRSKPSNADARRYTEQLCAKFLQTQLKWRSCFLQAQDELVHLKQQVVFKNQTEQGQIGLTASDDNGFPTPSSSASDADRREVALTSSYEFIHSVVSLARAARIDLGQPDEQINIVAGVRSGATHQNQASLNILLTETVPVCVRHLRRIVSKGSKDVSTQCIMQGLDGLMLLLNSDWTGCIHHLDMLLEQLGGLVDELLEYLLEPRSYKRIQCVQTRKLLHQMLLHLTTKIRLPERYTLLHSLATQAQTLCHSLNRNAALNPDIYECLAIALDCLQQGLLSLKEQEMHLKSLTELQQDVEKMLDLDLAHQFPLVFNMLLRLSSMVELCINHEVN